VFDDLTAQVRGRHLGPTLAQANGDQLIHGARQDLAAPCRQKPLSLTPPTALDLAAGCVGSVTVIGGPVIEFRPAAVDAGDGELLVQAMRDEIAELYDGLDLDGPTMPAAGASELRAPGGGFVVGYVDATPACCGGVKRLDERSCEIKKMYVVPPLRGRGVARALLHELEDVARRLGYELVRLDTGPHQGHAQTLFESEGYTPIEDFNGNPIAVFWGEKPI